MATRTPRLPRQYDIQFHPGVLIEEIIGGSQLDRELEPASTIVSIMGHPVTSIDEFFDQLSSHDLRFRPGVQITVTLPDETRYDTKLRLPQPEPGGAT